LSQTDDKAFGEDEGMTTIGLTGRWR